MQLSKFSHYPCKVKHLQGETEEMQTQDMKVMKRNAVCVSDGDGMTYAYLTELVVMTYA